MYRQASDVVLSVYFDQQEKQVCVHIDKELEFL
mgnify:CR=1 FL=1